VKELCTTISLNKVEAAVNAKFLLNAIPNNSIQKKLINEHGY